MTNRRARVALAGMLACLAALAIAACQRDDQPAPARYTPAGNPAVMQQDPTVIDTGSATGAVTNTVDPPAAHDSDMPTGEPQVTTTPPKPAAPATVQDETPLTTITENGTPIAPKPETQAPPAPTTPGTAVCGTQAGDPCS